MAADVFARLILLPVLVAQGIWVRRKAVFLPEPSGERSGQSGAGKSLRLLIIGDSSAAGVGADLQCDAVAGQLVKGLSQTMSVHWALHAETGETTLSALGKLRDLDPEPFDLAVVVLGVNDVTHAVRFKAYIRRQKAIAALLSQAFGVKHTVFSGLPPLGHFTLLPQPLRWVIGCQARRFDRGLEQLVKDEADVSHLELVLPYDPEMVAPDGYHPAPKAHHYWAELLVDHIQTVQSGKPLSNGP